MVKQRKLTPAQEHLAKMLAETQRETKEYEAQIQPYTGLDDLIDDYRAARPVKQAAIEW